MFNLPKSVRATRCGTERDYCCQFFEIHNPTFSGRSNSAAILNAISCLHIEGGLIAPSYQWSVANETALRNNLKNGYDKGVRPDNTTIIYMYFQMCSIDAVDIKDQSFTVSGWWYMKWDDSRLAWDEASYGDIDVVQFYEDDIWRPSIVVTNR
ncbi:acetylcholine receptor subunit alpha-like [Plakobranchus ocellatus]|uniref:Acetylcholine receptor subunit alpha-like n=1 Tax=Plakobranchus ocellatus TaxID=259542 RepID=A0AAV4BG10_9GAST|nr:acetylcholine receptor subunit alpha-like [Plakobranchus ocellatus]